MFINAPSLLIVIGGGLLFTLAQHGPKALGEALVAATSGGAASATLLLQHHHVLQCLRNSLCAAAAVGFLIGLIQILGNLSDPSQLGPAMAVALLCCLYGAILAELLVAPMARRLAVLSLQANAKTEDGAGGQPPLGDGARGLVTLVLIAVAHIGVMGLMLHSFTLID
jgi:hypothetical protein